MKQSRTFQRMVLYWAASLCLGNILWAQEAPSPSPVPIMNVENFRREMAQRHELKAKNNSNLKAEIKKLEKITRWAPLLPGPWASLAVREAEAGNTAQAEKDFQNVLRLSGDWAGGPGLYAAFLLNLGRKAEAEAVLRSLSGLHPGDGWVARQEAQAASETDGEKALRVWDAVQKSDPQADDVLLQIARCEFTQGNDSFCRIHLNQLRLRHPSCRDVIEWQERCAWAAGATKEAIGLRADLASRGKDCTDLAEWVDSLAAESPGQAVAYFGQAVARYPACPELWRKLGLAQEALGRPSDALASYQRAKDGLGDSDAFVNQRLRELGGVREETKVQKRSPPVWKGDAEGTLEDLRKMVFAREADVPMDLILRIARAKKSAESFRNWVTGWRERYPVSAALAMAESFEAEGRSSEAVEALKEAAARRPLDERPYERWCLLLDKNGRWEEGDAVCHVWNQVQVGDAPLVWNGIFLVRLKRYVEARPYFVEALQRHPQLFDAWEEWIQTLGALGEREAVVSETWKWLQWKPLDLKAWKEFQKQGNDNSSILPKGVLEKITKSW